MKRITILSLLMVQGITLFGQTSDSIKNKSKVFIEYNIVDLPFQIYAGKTVNSTIANPNASVGFFKGMQYQSMEQSTQIMNNVYTFSNWGVKQIPIFKKRPVFQTITHIGLSSLVNKVIGSIYDLPAWHHEEFHRNIMAVNYTNSYNPFSLFNKKEEAFGGAVSYVLDTNLVMMKDKNLSSFIRMHTAGGEAQIYSIENLQKQNFFNDQKLYLSVFYIQQFQDVINYIRLCSSKESSTLFTEDLMKFEGSRQELRDFTGLDYCAWAYDLWRPNEPYSGRGLNPYGNGYDRYIKGSDLTDEQLNWLTKQYKLSRLNLISPMNFFISSIKIKKLSDGSYLKGNFSVRYYPTSFGNQVGIDLMVKYKKWNIFATPHMNQNFKHNFPGLDIGVVDYPLNYKNKELLVSVNTVASLQPTSDGFLSDKSVFVGALKCTIKKEIYKRLYASVTASAKTKGWIKANPFMDNNVGLSMGLGYVIQRN